MKNHVELAYLILLLVTLIVNPPVVSNFKKTVLGKLVLLLGVGYLALSNKTYGMVAAFLTVCLMQNVREGMTNGEEEEEEEEKEAMGHLKEEEEEEDEKEGMNHPDEEEEEKEAMNHANEEEEKEEDSTTNKEGFALFSSEGSYNTSSMDRLAADEMLKSKPSNSMPVNDRERRGQDKSVVDSVFSSVRSLFR